MADKNTTRCSTSLFTRKTEINTKMIYPFTPTKMARFFFVKEYECWRGKNGILVHCWWECKMEQSPWKTAWWFLKELNAELPYDPAIPLSGNIPQRVESRDLNRYLCANVCCSIIHKSQKWKYPKCPLIDEWINKMWYIIHWNIIQFYKGKTLWHTL